MKKITLLAFFILSSILCNAQCIRPDQFGNIVSNNSGNFQEITNCAYSTEEYSVVSALVVGGNYTFTAQTGSAAGTGAHIYLTVTDASNVVIQHGPSPLTINSISSGTVRLHYSENDACLGESACKNSQVKYLTDCIVPQGLTSSNITTTTATIGWGTPATAPSDGYEYYVATTNTAPTSTTVPTGTVVVNSANLTSLTSGTPYFFWVRSKCGTISTAWSAIGSFTTICTPFTPSYSQNFATFVPVCWSVAGNGTPATGPTGTASGIWAPDGYLNSGSTGAIKVNLYSLNRIGWIMSPVFDLSAGGYRVKFDAGVTAWNASTASAMGSDDQVIFLVSIDNGVTWVPLETYDAANTPPNTGVLNLINLTGYTSASTRFAFYATDGTIDNTQDYDFFIDNFVVETIPACEAPIVTTSAVTSTSVNLSWAAIAGSASYEYVLDNVVTNPIGAGTVLTTTSYPATGLSPSTSYYFHVRTNCGATFSTWTTVNFTTLATPPANDECSTATALTVGGVFADNVTNGTNAGATTSTQAAPITCFGYSGGDVWYTVVVPASGNLTIETGNSSTGATGFDSVVTVYSGSCGALTQVSCNDDSPGSAYSKVVLTNQTPGATLYIRVYEYSNDATGSFGISAYSVSLSTISFNPENFKAYPNPVKDFLNLSYSQDISDVAIFNLLGQQVLARKVNATESKIDMSNLSQGTYLVKLTFNGQVKTIKVVKE